MAQTNQTSWWSRSSTSMKAFTITISVLVVASLVGVTVASLSGAGGASPQSGETATAVGADSHYLDRVSDDAPTVVEFLDFECEACGALYPYIEEVRQYFDGDINYVVRYFPLSGHFNSMNAALAVEAAAQQGKFEAMFHRMFETQQEWGEKQVSEADRFRGYAEDLGLDMEAFDAAVANPDTQARVQADFDAGQALGISGTPSFFLNGELIELTGPNDLPAAIEAALGRK